MLGLMKGGQSWRNTVSVATWGKLSKACLSGFFLVSLCLEDKDVPFLWVEGQHLSHKGFYDLLPRRKGGESHRDLTTPATFSDSFGFNSSRCPGACCCIWHQKIFYLGVACSEPQHLIPSTEQN